jgi:hypothetical protein
MLSLSKIMVLVTCCPVYITERDELHIAEAT